jgi:oxygen-independent coproporphyrinogen-3 oxidase
MCKFETSWKNKQDYFIEIPEVLIQLQEMEKDGLLLIGNNSIQVTENGKPHIRNICMAFDLHLKRKAPETELFSMTI